jgi:hypothetical protein
MAAAVKVAEDFKVEIIIIPKSMAAPQVKAPAVYLDDKVLAEDKGLRNGKITAEELMSELEKAGVPRYPRPVKKQER